MFPPCDLHALSSHCSNHATLLLHLDVECIGKRRFIFRPFWTKCVGFLDVVERAWHCPLRSATPFEHLDWLLRNTSRFLKSWGDCLIGNIWIQLAVAKEVIERLESAGDYRQLTAHEVELRSELKLKMLGMLSLQRTITRQESGVLWIKEGDVPTAFFHAHANARRWSNHIRVLQWGDQTLIAEDDKAVAIFDFFNEVLASPSSHSRLMKRRFGW
jgi:hypothetical protein